MKTINELYEALCRTYAEQSGREVAAHSDISVRLYAFAAELQSLYCYLDWSRAQCFPQTATGSYLDCFGEMRNLPRKQAAAAVGTVRFTRGTGDGTLTVPTGTVLLTQKGLHFVTTQDAVFAEGECSASCSAACCTKGSKGNVAAGAVCCFSTYPQGVSACRNPTAFLGGRDTEEDESYRTRLLADYRRSAGLANAAFYESFVTAFDGVTACRVAPRVNGVGTVGVVVETEGGSTNSALLEKIRTALQSAREVATQVMVSAPERVSVSYTVTLKPKTGISFSEAAQAAEAAIRAYFDGNLLGKPIYLTKLGSLIEATGLVETYHFDASCSDLVCTAFQRPWLEDIFLSEEAQ